jgi:hypothetical protein
MMSTRRGILSSITASGLALQGFANEAFASREKIKAVAFDAFPILDPSPVFALVDELYPETGRQLSARQHSAANTPTLTLLRFISKAPFRLVVLVDNQ